VIMGAGDIETREKEAIQLLEYGFGYFDTVKLFEKDVILHRLPVLNGEKTEVGLVPVENGVIRVPVCQKEGVFFKVDSVAPPEAPIEKNQRLGSVLISYGKNVLKTVALIANEDIERAGPPGAEEIISNGVPGKEEKIRKKPEETGSGSLKAFAARPYQLMLAICLLTLLLAVQGGYIIKLRKRIKKLETSGSELVKQRLKSVLKE